MRRGSAESEGGADRSDQDTDEQYQQAGGDHLVVGSRI